MNGNKTAINNNKKDQGVVEYNDDYSHAHGVGDAAAVPGETLSGYGG